MVDPTQGAAFSRRGRILVTLVILVTAAVIAALTGAVSRRSLERLTVVDARLQETGVFSGARLRLQRRAFEILPSQLAGNNLLVDDIRIQLVQARNLGSRLPDDVLASIDHLFTVLSLPLVSRNDLVAAALLLETIVDAEADAQERVLQDSMSDVRRERRFMLLGLLTTTGMALLLVWVVPRRAAAPFRPLFRFWLKGVVEQRRTTLRVERMALATEAAASLAHELRNPMAGVVLGLQNLERDADELSPRIRPLVEELQRVARTLGDHLDALRGPREEPVDVSIDRTLSDLTELLRYEAASGVAVESSVPRGLTCRTQPDRLRQLLLNLGLNGLQAMEGGGGTLRLSGERIDGRLVLRVGDSGPGFPESILAGVAPPFASLKEGGHGLGLRVVRRAVADLGGVMVLSNPPQGGALVEVRLDCPGETP